MRAPSLAVVLGRFKRLLSVADDAEILEGLDWYPAARQWLGGLPGHPAGLVGAAWCVGVAAARQSWAVTRWVVTQSAARGWVAPATLSRAQRAQWQAARAGVFPWRVVGCKSAEFALAILSAGQHGCPVDRHMLGAAWGLTGPVSEGQVKRLCVGGVADKMSEAVETLAARYGWGVGSTQAVVWVVWRARYSRAAEVV